MKTTLVPVDSGLFNLRIQLVDILYVQRRIFSRQIGYNFAFVRLTDIVNSINVVILKN